MNGNRRHGTVDSPKGQIILFEAEPRSSLDVGVSRAKVDESVCSYFFGE